MKIYTKTGDDGTTGLFGGARIGKDDARIRVRPRQDEAVGTLAAAWNDRAEIDAVRLRVSRKCLQRSSLRDPRQEMRRLQFVDAEPPRTRRFRLFGIRPDDLEIRRRPERDQRVARAEAGMLPARRGADAKQFFRAVDALLQVGHGVDEMIYLGEDVLRRTRRGRRQTQHHAEEHHGNF